VETLSKHHKPREVKKGEVWLAHDKESHKPRPFIVLSEELSGIDVDVNVSPVTTHEKRNIFDVELEFWQEAGLRESSIARCSKVHYIYHTMLIRKLGVLDDRDLEKINHSLRKFFAL